MKISIRKPDDMHVHLREGDMLRLVAKYTASVFGRALVMPNTTKPILTAADVVAYRRAIQTAAPELEPLMTIQLIKSTTPQIVKEAMTAGVVAAKFYPMGVTTNSENGSADLTGFEPTLSVMEKCGMVLCLHGETPDVFCMDREKDFLRNSLMPLARAFPRLRIVMEHVSTAEGVGYVESLPDNVAATITAHHLVLTLDDVIGGKLKPHNFCKPVAKRLADRNTLRMAATSGNPKFFLGTDSAPHPIGAKECAEGCAGVFSAPVAMEILAQVFEEEGKLEALSDFASGFGAWFYGLPPNDGHLVMEKTPKEVPLTIDDEDVTIPFMAGQILPWSVLL